MAELRLRMLAAVMAFATASCCCGGLPGGHRQARVPERQPDVDGAGPVLPVPDHASEPAAPRRHRGQPGSARACADAERDASGGRGGVGALHGVPVLLKDNSATRDRLNTTAGSLALLGSVVRRDAGVASRLRRAGVVILGKANPSSEWSNFRPVESGWSARGGQTLNPYVLSSSPCGSSAGPGVAAAANMAAVTLGSETDGSILWPSSANSVVGIKPTVGLTSRSGVVPITPRQDTIGPMCRTVSDAVHVLDAIVGYDALDAEATGAASKYIPPGTTPKHSPNNEVKGQKDRGIDAQNQGVYKNHLRTMRQHGAIVIEDIDIAVNMTDLYTQETIAMNAEFKISLNAYLSETYCTPPSGHLQKS
ncbi:hypothetical protein EJB05_12685, partial [Eragrostis curvula]